MRAPLILVAAVGLPLYALAQPVVDDGNPTTVSGITVEARPGQCPPGKPHGPYIISRKFDAPPDTKNKRTKESAGTRAFVQALAAGAANNDVDYTKIEPKLTKLLKAQYPRMRPFLACQGAFKGIEFLHVSQDGDDDFEVDFSNGTLEWAAPPFHFLQLTYESSARYFYPQPASRQFEDLLKSMEEGRPNYGDLTPDFAPKLQAQWPALQKALKDWGPLKGFRFARREDGGSYIYLATYEHRQVVWTAFPRSADGRFTALTYDEKAG